MLRRLCILGFLVALWPGLALAESNALKNAYSRSKALQQQGLYKAAERFAKKALRLSEREFGRRHPRTAGHLNNLAGLMRTQGRFADAELLYERALMIFEAKKGPDHPRVATALNNLALVYWRQGRYGEAEPLYKRALTILETKKGPDHPKLAATLNGLAELFRRQGRYADAESLSRRALTIFEAEKGPNHPRVARSLNTLAQLAAKQGRYDDAESRYERALTIFEAGKGADHPRVAATLKNLAGLYRRTGRAAEAEALFQRALAIFEAKKGPDHPNVAATLHGLANLYGAQGRLKEAEALYKREWTIVEAKLGPDHPRLSATLHDLAKIYLKQALYDQAIGAIRRATAIHRQRIAQAGSEFSSGAESEQRSVRRIFVRHLRIGHELMQREPAQRGLLVAETFELAQLTRATAASSAVARMAARFAAGDDKLAKVVRERQDVLERWRWLDEEIMGTSSQSPDQRDPAEDARLRAELESVDATLRQLDERLARDFPDYAEIAHPEPVPLAEAQALLDGDEALVVYVVSPKRTFMHVVRSGRAAAYQVEIGADELREAVSLLRSGLTAQDVSSLSDLIARGFEAETAYRLYRKLFAPAEPLLEGARHVFMVLDDALQSLPLGVLLTEAPQGGFADFAGYRQAPWLARKYAMTVLPSVSSLRALRRFAKVVKASKPFMGFGDPVLKGRPGGQRGVQVGGLFRGATADVDAVRRLSPLPETADELRAIAAVLNSGEGSLFLGAQATERTVRSIILSDSRVLAFATHGLVAGDFEGLAEPALVLTPPEVASDEDDGLLTASEIARYLKLDAGWVILSACNTAAGDKPGAEGLSGLAKAFFYAGARALLVSHWSVPSDAAVKLTTRMLAEAAENPGIARAEALRRSMLALMDDPDNPHFAHPLFWAPFVVVGEGGSPIAPGPEARTGAQPTIYVTVNNANVRAGPSTGAARIATLRKGTRITVLGKAADGNWFRIARGGKALGYVYAPLIAPQ